MKFVDEYRDPVAVRRAVDELARRTTRPWTIMEVCGGQTHAIVRFGIDELLPPGLTLIHGPGCPVCVTPIEQIERALELAARHDIVFCSFGDMLRVPGVRRDLMSVKAAGGDVRIVSSPLDAVRLAAELPQRQVVFFSVGFETTAPASAVAVLQAERLKLRNFSLLVSHVLVPPAMEAVLNSPQQRVQGFLAAGHVCAVTGYRHYEPLAQRYQVPIVVTGFEPLDLLNGLIACVTQREQGRAEVENQYERWVARDGNPQAWSMVERVFRVATRAWRGLGDIADSGLVLSDAYADFDAERRFKLDTGPVAESSDCLSGLVLQGRIKPHECPAFGVQCTPDHPLGATMVSSEGACAAYYQFRRFGGEFAIGHGGSDR